MKVFRISKSIIIAVLLLISLVACGQAYEPGKVEPWRWVVTNQTEINICKCNPKGMNQMVLWEWYQDSIAITKQTNKGQQLVRFIFQKKKDRYVDEEGYTWIIRWKGAYIYLVGIAIDNRYKVVNSGPDIKKTTD